MNHQESALTQAGGASALDRYFHYRARGGTLGGEIAAGLLVAFLSVCGMFINMQLLAKLYVPGDYAASGVTQAAANGEIYAQMYFIAMLLAFVGSLVMGLVARLPLVQVSGLGFGTVMISMAGTGTGLTAYNLLLVCFVSSLVYTVLVCVPGLWRRVLGAVPAPVRRALPAAAGLLMAFVAMQLTGLVSVNPSQISTYGAGAVLEDVSENVMLSGLVGLDHFNYALDRYHPLLLISAGAVVLTFVCYLVLKKRTAHPYLYSLLLGTGAFLALNICVICINWNNFGMSLDTMWGRLWMVGSEDALHHHLSKIFSSLTLGEIFTRGLDFTAYTEQGGNVALLFATGLLTCLFTSLFDGLSVLDTVNRDLGEDEERASRLALVCNAGMGVAAPLLGAAPLSLGKESCAGAGDGGKSGLTSVVASLVYLLSMFVWVVPFFFATVLSYDITFTMYGHYGAVLQVLTECSFAVADGVMVIMGLSMAARSLEIRWNSAAQAVPFVVTVAVTFFLSSIACGAAAGVVASVLVARQPEEPVTPGNLVWGLVSLALLILTALG